VRYCRQKVHVRYLISWWVLLVFCSYSFHGEACNVSALALVWPRLRANCMTVSYSTVKHSERTVYHIIRFLANTACSHRVRAFCPPDKCPPPSSPRDFSSPSPFRCTLNVKIQIHVGLLLSLKQRTSGPGADSGSKCLYLRWRRGGALTIPACVCLIVTSWKRSWERRALFSPLTTEAADAWRDVMWRCTSRL